LRVHTCVVPVMAVCVCKIAITAKQ
jgi:hypothetical protein